MLGKEIFRPGYKPTTPEEAAAIEKALDALAATASSIMRTYGDAVAAWAMFTAASVHGLAAGLTAQELHAALDEAIAGAAQADSDGGPDDG